MSLLERFVPKAEYESYEDFKRDFRIEVPADFNFAYDVVDVYASEEPARRAIVWCDDNGEEREFSFSDLRRYSNKAANFFKKHGIGKGDHVLLVMKSRYEFWYCLVGLHRIGAIPVPATHMLKTRDIVYRVKRADIKMAVCVESNGLAGHIERAQESCPEILREKAIVNESREGWIDFSKELEEMSEEFERPSGEEATSNGDVSLLYFSSGTVGYPKMIKHDFTYPLGHIITAKYWQNVRDGGLHYTVADSGWAKCVWGKIYGQWICGSAVFVYDYDKFAASKVLEKAAKYGVTTFCAPPTIYRFLIKEDLSEYDFGSLEYCVTAGEPLNPEVYSRFYEYTGLRLMEGFGQTETVVSLATFPWVAPKPGSMGKPSPCYEIMLMNSEGARCDVGEEGEIVIMTDEGKPVGMFIGYRNDEDKTESVWHDGVYHTGDMAWMDEDGYYWFVGRADDVIKSSGYRIGPFEVESALMQHGAVLECAITGVEDDVRGQIVKATVVLAKGFAGDEKLVKELQGHVKSVTAPYKYPRIVEFVEELPKTISGKIRRTEIRDRDKEI